MENNKILIYKNINMLKPTGGPNGYLYNLKKGLDIVEAKNIEFINNTYTIEDKVHIVFKKIKKLIPKFIRRNANNIRLYNSIINGKKENNEIEFNNYKFIHFHSTFDMYSVKDTLVNYKGKVLLTSHSPKPAYQELIDSCIDKYTMNNVKEKYNKLEQVDEYAFNRADYIVFPCEEAEEPYYNQWEKYKSIKEINKEKYRYIPTGISGCIANITENEIRQKYNIPKDAFLISYVGRHNEVKGYDRLKEIAKKVLKDNKDIYFIIAGKEGPLYKIENEKWIEVGWTNDPHSIIGASDLFILPNRETYFDLILLEVMSLGISILASYTGGNKYFKKYENSGIEFFENEADAITKIINLSKLSKNEIKDIGNRNKKIYEKNFNEEKFAKNYIELIETFKGD